MKAALLFTSIQMHVCRGSVGESAHQGQGAQLLVRHPFLNSLVGMDQVLESSGFPQLQIITLTTGDCFTQHTLAQTWLASAVITKFSYPGRNQEQGESKAAKRQEKGAAATVDKTVICFSPTEHMAKWSFPCGIKFWAEKVKCAQYATQSGGGKNKQREKQFRMGKGECTAELKRRSAARCFH